MQDTVFREFFGKEKAPYKMNRDIGYCYPVSIQFRTVLGGFSVLADPAPLARLEIYLHYSVFNLSRQLPAFDIQIIQYTLPKKQELYFPLRMRVRLFGLLAKNNNPNRNRKMCFYRITFCSNASYPSMTSYTTSPLLIALKC